MEYTLTADRILNAAKKCDRAKRTLEALFPEVFEGEAVFCKVGDVLIRKNTKSFYTLDFSQGGVRLRNLDLRNSYASKIDIGFSLTPLTKNQFKELLPDDMDVGEFRVLDIDHVHSHLEIFS